MSSDDLDGHGDFDDDQHDDANAGGNDEKASTGKVEVSSGGKGSFGNEGDFESQAGERAGGSFQVDGDFEGDEMTMGGEDEGEMEGEAGNQPKETAGGEGEAKKSTDAGDGGAPKKPSVGAEQQAQKKEGDAPKGAEVSGDGITDPRIIMKDGDDVGESEEEDEEEDEEEEEEEEEDDVIEEEPDLDDEPEEDKGKKRRRRKQGQKKKDGGAVAVSKAGKSLDRASEVWREPDYNSDDFVSQPIYTGDLVPADILLYYDSYGYDCGRRDNLHMIDDNTLVYISGNYLNFYSIKESKVFYTRRAAEGYGLGHIAIHPSRQYFAVGEKGHSPVIVVYKWPSVAVHRILRRGTVKGYSFLNFNPQGEVLCSQGADPDYMLTIWDWNKEKILLRCKAFANDIYRVTFSPTLAGDLTTCGVGHIRFWKMADTFTGLKLQGAIGRFGKTEISDIQDYVELPNGKVLSGCEWGNILVWDGGLIVSEICGMGDRTLHAGEITALIMTESNEVITVGKDGYFRIWDVDTIDIADTIVDDTGKYGIDPTNEIRLGGDAYLEGCIRNIAAPIEDNCWYCQDSWGRVWDCSISAAIRNNEYSPAPIFYTPGGGSINCIACSVAHTIMAVGTEGGHLWLINYITKEPLVRRHYKTSITKLFWLPLKYDPKGVTFLAAFGDGCIRSYCVQPISAEAKAEEDELPQYEFQRGLPFHIGLNQVLRFSRGAITVMKFDEDNEILYVCGDDRSLWGVYLFYDENEDCALMEPLAYFKTPFSVHHLALHPANLHRMIIAGKSARVAECRRPKWTECVSEKSFYQGRLYGRRWWFNSCKSERRKVERKEWRKGEKERRIKLLQEDWKRRQLEGILVNRDGEMNKLHEEFKKAQQEDDEEPIYKPEKPSRFTGIYYHINPKLGNANLAKTFFLHTGDYDAGYIYECKCSRPEVGGFHVVPPTPPFKKEDDDVAVSCWLLSKDNEYLLFGMADGSIRVMPRVNIQKKLAEIMKLELEEARKKKLSKQHDDVDDVETDATTAPPLPQDHDKNPQKKRKKSLKGALPPFQASIYPYDLENFFALPMHDPNRGAVNQLSWSSDSQFLISVATDGSMFSYRWDPEGYLDDPRDKLPDIKLPTTQLTFEFIPDEEDPAMLTVEETKLEEEHEKVRILQEGFKEDVRTELRDLREVFHSIKQRNKEIPEQYRLTEEELKLPDEIYAQLQHKLDEEVEEVFKIHEYESMQTIIQMEKIHKNFFHSLLYQHIVVKDISHKIETHTIRQKKLSDDFLRLRSKNDDVLLNGQIRSTVDLEVAVSDLGDDGPNVTRVYAKDIIGEYAHKLHTYNVETVHNIRHLERRLEERYYRELAWAELIRRKIKKDFIDPEDARRLQYAKANRGDFQLQAKENFLGDHSTTAERRQKILDLKMWIHETTEDYNKKVIECRDEKIKVLKECKNLEGKIKMVQPFIPPELRRKLPPIFGMETCETPETAFDITLADIEAEENAELHAAMLIDFREQMNEELFGVKRAEKPLVTEEEIKDFMAPSIRHTKTIDLEFENMTVHKYRKHIFTPKTEKEQTRYEVMVWPKLIEQEVLFKELLGIIEYFHNRVKYLHDQKIQMDIDLHIKHIGLMTLIRELDIAKEFEIQEKGILERIRVQKEECHDARHKLDLVKKRLTKLSADLKKLEGEHTLIMKEAHIVINDKAKWSDYLTKVFKKRVKAGHLDENVSNMSLAKRASSGDDSSDLSESAKDHVPGSTVFTLSKMKLDIDVCPEHLDKATYSRVCELRNRKAVVEVEIDIVKREVDKVSEEEKEMDKIHKSREGRLVEAGQDIKMLQRRRQKRMNELKCMVILRLDQINCVDMDEVGDVKGSVFEKLVRTFPGENKILVFPQGETSSLEQRSKDLSVFTDQEKQRMKNGRQMQMRLIEELKKAEKRVEELKVKVKKDMMMKFGGEVDLDKVTAAIINLELLDKEIQLDKLRRFHYLQRQRMADNILDAKDELTSEIRENSNLKILKAMVLEKHRNLDYFIWMTEKEQHRKERRDESRKRLADPGRHSDSVSPQGIPGDIKNLRTKVRLFEARANELRNALCVCKHKSGLPPILPLDRPVRIPSKTNKKNNNSQQGQNFPC